MKRNLSRKEFVLSRSRRIGCLTLGAVAADFKRIQYKPAGDGPHLAEPAVRSLNEKEKRVTQEQTTAPYLKEYLQYIGGHPDTKVTKEFVCDAYRDEGQSFALGTKPGGRFLVYPEFCAFLSTMRGDANSAKLFADRFSGDMIDQLRVMGVMNNPGMMVFHIAKGMGRDEDEEEKKYIRAALTNPNSFFIPMNRITGVNTERKFSMNTITIETSSDRYVLFDNMMTTCPDPLTWGLKKLSGGRPLGRPSLTGVARYYGRMVTGSWQPEVVEILRQAANTNKNTR